MPMPLISIIVPIYNGEKYLSKCLDSILAQRFEDFELLLINDGSQDSSLSICRKYAQADKRISIYDIPNGGVSAARNVGIDNATGEWVMFIDSDDWVEEGLLETGLPYFNEYDMIDIATYIDETIIDYLNEGLTTANRRKSLRERFYIMCHYYGTMPTIMRHIAFIPRFIKQTLKERKNR
jgi:glycosyltransferase involved in cell wall biosynthesis